MQSWDDRLGGAYSGGMGVCQLVHGLSCLSQVQFPPALMILPHPQTLNDCDENRVPSSKMPIHCLYQHHISCTLSQQVQLQTRICHDQNYLHMKRTRFSGVMLLF